MTCDSKLEKAERDHTIWHTMNNELVAGKTKLNISIFFLFLFFLALLPDHWSAQKCLDESFQLRKLLLNLPLKTSMINRVT